MSQHPDEQSRPGAEDADFESGLDYGSFTSEDPDYPEDHLNDPAPEQPAPTGASPDAAVADEQQHATRSLSEELAAQRAASERSEHPRADHRDTEGQTSEQPTTVIPPSAGTSDSTPASTTHASATPPSSASPSAAATENRSSTDNNEHATTVVPPVTPVRERSPAPTAGEADQPVSPTPLDSPAPLTSGQPAHARDEAAVAARPVRTAPANEDITDADIDAEVAKTRRGASRFLTVLVAIFTPVLFLVAALRIVGSPVFLWATYQRPGFPDDPQGFGLDERMLYGSYGMDFLFNLANSRYLADLTGPDGELLFTSQGADLNEVSHMMDVKQLVWIAMLVGLALLVLTLLFALLLRSWRPGGFARGVFAGAWVSIGLLIGLVVLAFLDWQEFFAQFHGVLFSGNWQFPEDYALIRLYPNQFWIDAGIWMAALLLIFSVVALLMTWPTARRRARRAERLAEVHERRREKLIDELNSASV